MNFPEFASKLGIDVDSSMAGLVDHALRTCEKYNVSKREDCVRAFVSLADYARVLVDGRMDFTSRHLDKFSDIRDLAGKLKEKIDELSDSEADALAHCNLSSLNLTHDFAGALNAASKALCGLRSKRDVITFVGKRFVVLCHEYQIPVRWSKDLYNCSKYCSAQFLAALFEAAHVPFSGDEGKRTAAHSANNCLYSLSKGFEWSFADELHGVLEFGVVYLDRIVRENNLLEDLPRFAR
ncbi:hypothetical protein OX459_15815 [Janthinobacterium sp. SUN026]|uniref:hypothetical protein n=1 Tax=Janthinobacterium sp. SUN026 TaxID=3002438 RepID=UPI0025AF466C|nr:hypothetical protein [Janthinobacterium sp. SUN026]MDN2672870.1 hypothetical protein [Janthinobacterium sp. SUN026]